MDVGVLHKTKLTDGIYTKLLASYKVVATSAPSQHHGRVALLYCYSHTFAVKAISHFGANAIACQLEKWGRRWYIVGSYLAPGDNTTIRDVEAAMAERLRGARVDFLGDFNLEL